MTKDEDLANMISGSKVPKDKGEDRRVEELKDMDDIFGNIGGARVHDNAQETPEDLITPQQPEALGRDIPSLQQSCPLCGSGLSKISDTMHQCTTCGYKQG